MPCLSPCDFVFMANGTQGTTPLAQDRLNHTHRHHPTKIHPFGPLELKDTFKPLELRDQKTPFQTLRAA